MRVPVLLGDGMYQALGLRTQRLTCSAALQTPLSKEPIVMKLIIAYLPCGTFESVRAELLDLGVARTTISEVRSAGPQSEVTLRYRGAPLRTHLRPELRLECLATAEQSDRVVDALRTYSGSGSSAGRVAVIDLEQLHHGSVEDRLYPDDPRLEPVDN